MTGILKWELTGSFHHFLSNGMYINVRLKYAVIIHMFHQTLAQRAGFDGNVPYFISVQILSFS